jgi:hypothetical protein
MEEWLAAQLAAGLPAFTGSQISGTVAVTPEVFNELIAKWLTGESLPPQTSALAPTLMRKAIKSARVRAEHDRIFVDVEISL